MKKFIALLLAGVMTMSLLTACGGGNASETASDASEAESTENEGAGVSDTESEPEADINADAGEDGAETDAKTADAETDDAEGEADAQSEALSDGVLTVGTNAEFPPFEYVGDDGEPDGFDIALIKAIGEKLGVEVQVENMEFDSLVASIGSKVDVSIAGMTVTEERQKSVDFSEAYYEAVQYVILPEGSEIATAADLEGKAIGVQLGTTGDFIASDDIADSKVSQYNKGMDAVNDLINGKVDCVIIDKNPALVFASKFEGQLAAVDGAEFGFEPEEYAIAMPKGDAALAEQVNAALAEIKADGTFDKLVETYIEN
ncbi:basic amino acid ABC transporter substrate-binding protein [Parablautia intestinalis]|uniref:Basic amino acid ABC transporter substrate-binding protein n=1 Tax=Parablautia intestinalis TaxID=2320100 RepID=A0A3A9AN21_9FIRM|nr:basic amino acid ABC transporter substrate-binding protein [Parablautia intestinalis]RKI92424.1 basic amino acid ABC transporter substrate-binding protein [Parablautia intestinalis]